MFVSQAIADPVIVAQTGANSDLSNSRQIVRTSTGRIYYLGGNAGHTSNWDGWLEVHTSGDGSSWSKENTRDQWYLDSDIGVSIDSKNILHVISYDWNHHPYYIRYNTADSPTSALTWDGYELLESTKTSDIGKCAVAVDANGMPHVLYQSVESYKGKTYYTLTYANRVGTAWSKVAVWPKELTTNFSGKIEIAIGLDNIPYILTGNKMLKGNSNAATSFETKDLGSAGTSFVIQQNGDVKVSQISNGKYSVNSHYHASPWSSGWTFAESATPDTGSILLLANDTLYAARLMSDGIWLQKNLDPPFLAAPQPANTTWQSLTARWSSYNHSKQGIIDLGTRSWNLQNGNLLWYSANLADSRANFYGGPFLGVAPLTVTLSDSSIPREGSNITSWEWDFENDGTADASGSNASHVYATPGKYSVSLAITDSSGGQDKIVRPNLIQVDGDSDGDGIPDSRDNCPFDYNPLQIDFNVNGIGDTCEAPINRIAIATYMTRLRSLTEAEKNTSNITTTMTDGLFNTSSILTPATYDAISFTINKEARDIKQLTLEYYALGAAGYPNYSYAYIMPYNSDFSTTVDVGMMGQVYNGWNVVDLAPILHRMDGFGKVKFRLAPSYNGFNVYELRITETVDKKVIVVAPAAVDFGSVEIPKRSVQSVVVKNAGAESLNIVRVRTPSAPFAIENEDCSGKVLANNASCNVSIVFTPGYNIDYEDVLIIDSDDAEQSSKRITLTGAGTLVLSGVVKDAASSQPLGNVTVMVTDTVRTQTVTTDSNGVYVLTGASAGGCSATFSRADYKTITIQSVIQPSKVNSLDAQLAFDYATISGSVTDQATGLPISGAKVTLTLSNISSKNPADRQYLCNSVGVLTTAEYALIANNDSQKYGCKNYYDFNGNSVSGQMRFRVRNPYGRDPFTFKWNGIATLNDIGTEYLAQSFTPGKNGQLTRVAFYLNESIPYYVRGETHVLLKSALGGDRGNYLAKSNSVDLDTVKLNGGAQWVFFDFPAPVNVTTGQHYYLEINGMYFNWSGSSAYLYRLNWRNTTTTTQGTGYRRDRGFWNIAPPLALQTIIDGQADVSTLPDGITFSSMYGANDVRMNMYIKSGSTTAPPYFFHSNIDDTDDGQRYTGKNNGDDLTALGTVTETPELRYDANGWIEVVAYAQSIWPPDLVTDQFSLTFNRTLSTTTDVSGAYSFPNIIDGDYTVIIDKTAYNTEVVNGGLLPGQAVAINRTLSVNSDLRIITNTLSAGSVRNYYNQSMAATGGRAPYKWSLIAGVLPSGLTLNSATGVITGVPVVAFNTTIVVQVQDANNKTVAKAFTLRIFQTFVSPRISVSPSEVSFGGAIIGKMLSSIVTVTNTGTTDLVVGKITQPSEPFQVITDNCSNKILAAAAACTITIQFSPAHTGSFYENIDIPSSDENYPVVSVFLSGAGIISYFLPDTGRGELVKNPLTFTLNNESSATDDNTHLVWQRGGSAAAMTWPEAGAYCRDLAIDGYHDWRLPSFLELITIVNYGAANPAIASVAFPGTRSDNYWTAFEGTGQINGNPDLYAGVVNFAYGEAHPLEKGASAFVRCTRGETLTYTFSYSGAGDGNYPYTNGMISTDRSTGLVWVISGVDPYVCDPLGNCVTLSQINDCRILKYAGRQDWRNPTIKELATLSNQLCYLDSCFTMSATPSGRPDALGNLSNIYMFSPGIDIISTPTSTNHGLNCVSGGNQAWSISGLAVSGIVADGAVIQWNTTQPATGEVQYGETSAYGGVKTDSNLTTQHTITLSGLNPATTYHYKVTSTNAQGVVVHSDDQTFTTPRFSATNLGDTGNIDTIEISGNFDAKNPDGSQNDPPRKAVATEYFKTHPDKDFLVFFSTFDYTMPEGEAKGFYTEVKNDTQGINRTILDNSAQYDSAGMLQGTIDMGNITPLVGNPYGPKLEEAMTTLGHELGHRWLAAVRFKNPDGTPNTSLIGRDDAHWSYLLDSKGSLMYGNGWKDNGDGTFTSTSVRNSYSPLDLYLMGMIPKEQVPPMLLIDNPAIDKTKLPELGATISGTAKTVTINDIIAASGERVPTASTSPKSFNIGFVLLTRAGDNATAATQGVETVRKAFAGRFAELTQGMGSIGNVAPSLELAVDSPADGASVTGPDVTVSGAFINTTGVETGVIVNGIVATVNGNRFIANHVPLQQGSNSIEIKATDANGLTATTTRSVTATPGNYIRITSNIESGIAPLKISLRLDSSFNIANPQLSVTGPVAVTLTPGTSPTEFTATLTAEGAYTISVSAVGPDGQIYSDTVTVTAISRTKLENLLKGKWEGMKAALVQQDIISALKAFSGNSRQLYNDIFTTIYSQLPQLVQNMQDVKFISAEGNSAKCRIRKNQMYGGQPYAITHYIYFSQGETGLWKIDRF